MRSSAPSIDRVRSAGFSLLEVIAAVTLFSIVIAIALAQMIESSDATRYAVVRADLRREGERVLAQIVQDLRSTDAQLAGAVNNGSETAIDFCKIKGFDSTNSVPILGVDKDLFGAGVDYATSGTNIATNAFVWKYAQPNVSCATGLGDGGRDASAQGYLLAYYGPLSSYPPANLNNPSTAGISARTLTQELALRGDTMPNPSGGTITVDGFTVTAFTGGGTSLALPGLISTSGGTTSGFGNQPTYLTIKLVMKRRVEKTGSDIGQFAWVTVQTNVMLRADQRY